MKHAIRTTVLTAATLAAALGGPTSAAHAEAACPPGHGLYIEDGARIHRSSDLTSPVDGLYYTTHGIRIHEFLGGTPALPAWVRITDTTTNVTGWLHGSVATCLMVTPR